MSSEAIARRLRQVSELRDLCLALMKSKPITAERASHLRRMSQKERPEKKRVKQGHAEGLGSRDAEGGWSRLRRCCPEQLDG